MDKSRQDNGRVVLVNAKCNAKLVEEIIKDLQAAAPSIVHDGSFLLDMTYGEG